jgi:hypothetical protein
VIRHIILLTAKVKLLNSDDDDHIRLINQPWRDKEKGEGLTWNHREKFNRDPCLSRARTALVWRQSNHLLSSLCVQLCVQQI